MATTIVVMMKYETRVIQLADMVCVSPSRLNVSKPSGRTLCLSAARLLPILPSVVFCQIAWADQVTPNERVVKMLGTAAWHADAMDVLRSVSLDMDSS